MRGIRLRRRARHRGARVGDQPLDQRDRPRRRGDELARPRARAAGRTAACRRWHRHGATWRARRTRRRRTAARAAAPGPRPRTRRPPRRSAIRAAGAMRGPLRPLAARRRRATGRRGPRSSPRARRARSRRPARCARAARRHKAQRHATSARTHSAPARVLPAPRPPSSSQVRPGRAVIAGHRRRRLMRMRQRDEVTVEPQQRRRRQSPAASPSSGRLATQRFNAARKSRHGIRRGRRACRHSCHLGNFRCRVRPRAGPWVSAG